MKDSKRCPGCAADLPRASFGRNAAARDGLQSRCKPCHAAAVRASCLAHPERVRRYRAANRTRRNEQVRAWRERNAAHVAEYDRAYQLAHPEVKRASNAKRYAAKRRAPTDVTRDSLREHFAALGDRCAYCLRADVKLQTDHVTPLIEGGAHALANIVPACGPCNARKNRFGVLSMLNHCASASRSMEIAA